MATALSHLGRFLIVLMFILTGWSKIQSPEYTSNFMITQTHTFDSWVKNKGMNIPIPLALLEAHKILIVYVIGVLELVGGVCVTFNILRKYFAWMLFFMMIPFTVIGHNPFY